MSLENVKIKAVRRYEAWSTIFGCFTTQTEYDLESRDGTPITAESLSARERQEVAQRPSEFIE